MKPAKIYLLWALLSCLVCGCYKRDTIVFPATTSAFESTAFLYLQNHLSASELGELDIKGSLPLPYGGRDKFLLFPAKTGYKKMVLLEQVDQTFNGYRVSLERDGHNSGTLTTEQIGRVTRSIFNFTNGRVTKIERHHLGVTSTSIVTGANDNLVFGPQGAVQERSLLGVSGEEQRGGYKTLPEVIFTVKTGSASYDLYSLYYYTNQNPNYYYSYSNVSGAPKNNGGGSGGSGAITDVPIAEAATKPVAILNELKCFTAVNGATYSLKINVNQPTPNTRTVLNVFAEHPVGHCYLTLEQRNPNGLVITRNVGWYPTRALKPGENVRGTYQDDTDVPVAVSFSVSVNAGEFQKVKTYLTNTLVYALQGLNCTNIAVNAFAEANVRLPQTTGYVYMQTNNYIAPPSGNVPVYKGLNPGDMGQDIRGLDAQTFSRQNGNRKVVIQKSGSNSQKNTKNGTCS